MYLDDTDPRWAAHSGGSGHDEPDWQSSDLAEAVAYYEALSQPAREIFDHLRATPGRMVSCDEIAERLNLNPDGTKNNPNVVAGHMNTAGRARMAAGRRFPFYWWKTDDGATYAVQRSVADVFDSALRGRPAQ